MSETSVIETHAKPAPAMLRSAPTISVLIIAKDAEAHLEACIQSVSAWAYEVIVAADPSSRDATEAIARKCADVVIVRRFDDFAGQRNAALAAAQGAWVLAIDADERADAAIAAEILEATRTAGPEVGGFRVPIRSLMLGRRFRFSGTQFDLPLRLFRKDQGAWIGKVHETVALDGSVRQLKHALFHYAIPNMSVFLSKIDRYTTLEAAELYARGVRPRLLEPATRPMWVFVRLYLLKQGFRDGLEGLAFCALSGVSAAVRWFKLRELWSSGGPA